MEHMSEKKSVGSSSTMVAPGFRFHPTDEELVRYYLKRKINSKAFRFDAISEIDIYKSEPWELPGMSKLKTRDLEWYFFSVLDKKHGNGSRTNRITGKGYWKTTGKDRAVYRRTQIVGMKKTLVYHNGRAPKGQRTNWVMHEYRLTDLELERGGIVQKKKDAYVLCRVFQKSGSGPKNGEQYGAPFVEEEWDDDELELVPRGEVAEKVDFSDGGCLDGLDIDLEQILQSDVPSDGSCVNETAEPESNTQNLLVCTGKHYSEPEQHDDFYDLLVSFETDVVEPVKHKYIGESSNKPGNSENLDFMLDGPFFDAFDTPQYGEGGFIEANDLSNPADTQTSGFDMLDEYLTSMDANYDPFMIAGSEDLLSDQFLPPRKENEGIEQASFIEKTNNDVALPSDKKELAKFQSDYQYTFIKRASQMLGNFPAPPAFAAEFPSKNAILRLNSVAQSSNSVHVTAGMVQLRNSNVGSSNKHGNLNIILSFGFARGDDGSSSLESSVSIFSGKNVSTFFFMSFWFLFLFMSFKIGTYICA